MAPLPLSVSVSAAIRIGGRSEWTVGGKVTIGNSTGVLITHWSPLVFCQLFSCTLPPLVGEIPQP